MTESPVWTFEQAPDVEKGGIMQGQGESLFLCKAVWKPYSSGLRFTFKGKLADLPIQWQFLAALIVSLNLSITPTRQCEGVLTLASTIKINSARKAKNTIHFRAISEKQWDQEKHLRDWVIVTRVGLGRGLRWYQYSQLFKWLPIGKNMQGWIFHVNYEWTE